MEMETRYRPVRALHVGDGRWHCDDACGREQAQCQPTRPAPGHGFPGALPVAVFRHFTCVKGDCSKPRYLAILSYV